MVGERDAGISEDRLLAWMQALCGQSRRKKEDQYQKTSCGVGKGEYYQRYQMESCGRSRNRGSPEENSRSDTLRQTKDPQGRGGAYAKRMGVCEERMSRYTKEARCIRKQRNTKTSKDKNEGWTRTLGSSRNIMQGYKCKTTNSKDDHEIKQGRKTP